MAVIVMRHQLPFLPAERFDLAPVCDRGILAVECVAGARVRAEPEHIQERDLDRAAVCHYDDRLALMARDDPLQGGRGARLEAAPALAAGRDRREWLA